MINAVAIWRGVFDKTVIKSEGKDKHLLPHATHSIYIRIHNDCSSQTPLGRLHHRLTAVTVDPSCWKSGKNSPANQTRLYQHKKRGVFDADKDADRLGTPRVLPSRRSVHSELTEPSAQVVRMLFQDC